MAGRLSRVTAALPPLSRGGYSSVNESSMSERREGGFKRLDGLVDATTEQYRQRYSANHNVRSSVESARAAAASGGSERSKLRYTRDHGKLLLADRLALVVDSVDDILPVGTLAGCEESLPGSGAGVFTGVVSIKGRQVMLCAQDGTVKGGATYPIGLKKQLCAQRLGRSLRLPSVVIVDSAGAFLPLQADIFPDRDHGGRIFRNEAVLGALNLTQFAVVAGSCTAGGAYAPTMCDHAIIVDKIGTVFLGGPPLVRAATGEIVTAEQLGGATTHCVHSGAMDYKADSEPQAYALLRDLVSVAPGTGPRVLENDDSDDSDLRPLYPVSDLIGLAGQNEGVEFARFIKQVLARILDRSEFCEFRQLYGAGLVTGWGRLSGDGMAPFEGDKAHRTMASFYYFCYLCTGALVGIIASTGAKLDRKSCEKASQFVQMCSVGDSPVPLVIMQRSLNGGWNQYDASELKGQAQLIASLAQSQSLKITVNVGDSCGRGMEPTFYFAWPNARIAYDLVDLERQSALQSASELHVDDIIMPEDTRQTLIRCLRAMPRHPMRQLHPAAATRGQGVVEGRAHIRM